jgi:RNA-binding proteins (RRM domain)
MGKAPSGKSTSRNLWSPYMATSIYVGNLPWSATQEGVESLFSPYGEVLSVKLVSDRETGRARGFGFVEMEDADAINAIAALDGKEFEGRALRINKAEPKKPAPRRW